MKSGISPPDSNKRGKEMTFTQTNQRFLQILNNCWKLNYPSNLATRAVDSGWSDFIISGFIINQKFNTEKMVHVFSSVYFLNQTQLLVCVSVNTLGRLKCKIAHKVVSP